MRTRIAILAALLMSFCAMQSRAITRAQAKEILTVFLTPYMTDGNTPKVLHNRIVDGQTVPDKMILVEGGDLRGQSFVFEIKELQVRKNRAFVRAVDCVNESLVVVMYFRYKDGRWTLDHKNKRNSIIIPHEVGHTHE